MMQTSLVGANRLLTNELKALEEYKDKEVNNFKNDNLALKKSLDVAEAQKKEMESRINEQENEIDNLCSFLARAQIDAVDQYKPLRNMLKT